MAETAELPSFHKIWTSLTDRTADSATRKHRLIVEPCQMQSMQRRCLVPSITLAFAEGKRADERTRTADLLQLRVIHQTLRGVAQGCKPRISKRFSLLRLAPCCTVLRSRWYQSGIKRCRTNECFRPYMTGAMQNSTNEVRRTPTSRSLGEYAVSRTPRITAEPRSNRLGDLRSLSLLLLALG